MIDCFALLEELRRPWLDLNELKEKFIRLSAVVHPDRIQSFPKEDKQTATDRYTALNSAYTTLREPKKRVMHLIELERGVKPTGIDSVPPEIMGSFIEVGQLCRDVDGFLTDRTKTSSPLLKVQMFERAMEWTGKLNLLVSSLEAELSGLISELRTMNDHWEKAPPPGDTNRISALPLDDLERLYRSLSFVTRWIGQLRERIVKLSL